MSEPERSWTVEAFKSASGREHVFEYIERELNPEEQAEMLDLIDRLEEHGPDRSRFLPRELKQITHLPRREKSGGLKLFELRIANKKAHNPRVFFAALKGREILLLHGFSKDTEDTPKGELELAYRRFHEHLRRKNG